MRRVPLHRRVLSYGALVTMCLRFRVPGVRDYSCFYRAYRIAALRRGVARFGERPWLANPADPDAWPLPRDAYR